MGQMHRIKKYNNRKLYDTTDKRFISMDEITELIKAGEEVSIHNHRTGQDLTASIVSQLLGRKSGNFDSEVPSKVLFQLLRKGSKGLVGSTRKYFGFWQNALTMAEDELDKFVNVFVKDNDISMDEGRRFKKEIIRHNEQLTNWINDQIEERVSKILKKKRLSTKRQLSNLKSREQEFAGKIETVVQESLDRIGALEKHFSEMAAKSKKKPPH